MPRRHGRLSIPVKGDTIADYIPVATDAHGRDEELQWTRVLAAGDPARGMALVLIQKMCAVFHEFEPAWRARALNPQSLEYFRGRLAGRTSRVLEMMDKNGLSHSDGVADLRKLLVTVQSAQSMEELADLAEVVHALGHKLCEGLEAGR